MRLALLFMLLVAATPALAAPCLSPPLNSTGPLSESAIAKGDFDRDGTMDLAVVGTSLQILLGLDSLGVGNGRFAPPVTYTLPSAGRCIVADDFNGDAFLDVAVGAG